MLVKIKVNGTGWLPFHRKLGCSYDHFKLWVLMAVTKDDSDKSTFTIAFVRYKEIKDEQKCDEVYFFIHLIHLKIKKWIKHICRRKLAKPLTDSWLIKSGP